MPKRLNPKKIMEACRLHFNGDLLGDIAVLLDINRCTLSRWRQTDIWINYEAKLIEEWELAQGGNATNETATQET
ncbi:MAG: hypothetical protein OXU27_17025 [Candidatus Poribacteria bacterium]|nr:hypothetical protein [Candidatus Poribacteria bacterium]MDE0323294.1 hypothetical protein [Candidatus Poribacteria bacterium]